MQLLFANVCVAVCMLGKAVGQKAILAYLLEPVNQGSLDAGKVYRHTLHPGQATDS